MTHADGQLPPRPRANYGRTGALPRLRAHLRLVGWLAAQRPFAPRHRLLRRRAVRSRLGLAFACAAHRRPSRRARGADGVAGGAAGLLIAPRLVAPRLVAAGGVRRRCHPRRRKPPALGRAPDLGSRRQRRRRRLVRRRRRRRLVRRRRRRGRSSRARERRSRRGCAPSSTRRSRSRPVSRPYLPHISPTSRLYLHYVPPISHLYLTYISPYISPISHPYLPCISPLTEQAAWAGT